MSKHRTPTRWSSLSTRINVGSVLLAVGIVLILALTSCAQPAEEVAAEPKMTQAEALEELEDQVMDLDPRWFSWIPMLVDKYCGYHVDGISKDESIALTIDPAIHHIRTEKAASLIWDYATEYEC